MSKRTIYVCSSVKDGNLISESIQAPTKDEACLLFYKQFSTRAKKVSGPFYHKREEKIKDKVLKFSNQIKKAIYDDWMVNAIILNEPKDHAYLVFIKRIDEQAAQKPKGIVKHIAYLRFIC